MTEKLGFCELLERSAEVIEREAESLRVSFVLPSGRWDRDSVSREVRGQYDELRALAKQLRRAHKYAKPNPLGGPAVVFDACADAIRAGDPIKRAMADFGLAWANTNTEETRG